MEDHRTVKVFIDDQKKAFSEFRPPAKLLLDTTKLTDGKHRLKIVARSSEGKEGVKIVPFEVRNGPAISIVGLKENDIVDDKISVTINAYGSERSDEFVIEGSETPKAIPSWVWAVLIGFVGWAIYYLIMYWNGDHYLFNF